jgi:hypothetical protein
LLLKKQNERTQLEKTMKENNERKKQKYNEIKITRKKRQKNWVPNLFPDVILFI